jgi:hypothetical protein
MLKDHSDQLKKALNEKLEESESQCERLEATTKIEIE